MRWLYEATVVVLENVAQTSPQGLPEGPYFCSQLPGNLERIKTWTVCKTYTVTGDGPGRSFRGKAALCGCRCGGGGVAVVVTGQ